MEDTGSPEPNGRKRQRTEEEELEYSESEEERESPIQFVLLRHPNVDGVTNAMAEGKMRFHGRVGKVIGEIESATGELQLQVQLVGAPAATTMWNADCASPCADPRPHIMQLEQGLINACYLHDLVTVRRLWEALGSPSFEGQVKYQSEELSYARSPMDALFNGCDEEGFDGELDLSALIAFLQDNGSRWNPVPYGIVNRLSTVRAMCVQGMAIDHIDFSLIRPPARESRARFPEGVRDAPLSVTACMFLPGNRLLRGQPDSLAGTEEMLLGLLECGARIWPFQQPGWPSLWTADTPPPDGCAMCSERSDAPGYWNAEMEQSPPEGQRQSRRQLLSILWPGQLSGGGAVPPGGEYMRGQGARTVGRLVERAAALCAARNEGRRRRANWARRGLFLMAALREPRPSTADAGAVEVGVGARERVGAGARTGAGADGTSLLGGHFRDGNLRHNSCALKAHAEDVLRSVFAFL
jgi:hypothetical protein